MFPSTVTHVTRLVTPYISGVTIVTKAAQTKPSTDPVAHKTDQKNSTHFNNCSFHGLNLILMFANSIQDITDHLHSDHIL